MFVVALDWSTDVTRDEQSSGSRKDNYDYVLCNVLGNLISVRWTFMSPQLSETLFVKYLVTYLSGGKKRSRSTRILCFNLLVNVNYRSSPVESFWKYVHNRGRDGVI